MKYIVIILFIILILFFESIKSIEYKKEKLEVCDYNCGKHQTEGECLSCKNCGVCRLVKNNTIKTYCLPGDKNGSFFNEDCKGNTWTFKGDDIQQLITTPVVPVVERTPRNNSVSSYSDILKGLGQKVDEENILKEDVKYIGKTIIPEEKDRQIGISNLENKSYQDVLNELESLSNLLK
jgi:hypothetical protein